jgi:hypothetical protein
MVQKNTIVFRNVSTSAIDTSVGCVGNNSNYSFTITTPNEGTFTVEKNQLKTINFNYSLNVGFSEESKNLYK